MMIIKVRLHLQIIINFLGYTFFYLFADIKVKFSLKDDIDDAECQRLLLMYMPECVRQTKITQKLFIK